MPGKTLRLRHSSNAPSFLPLYLEIISGCLLVRDGKLFGMDNDRFIVELLQELRFRGVVLRPSLLEVMFMRKVILGTATLYRRLDLKRHGARKR